MTTIQTEARNASLEDLVPMLRKQHDLKLDAVVPMTAMRSVNGVLCIEGLRVFGDAYIRPTAIMDGQIAGQLGIPVKYLRELRERRIDLYDENVNRWILGSIDHPTYYAPDDRTVLVRTFSDPEGGEGIGRALLSDKYAPIENIDVLMAALEGINASGVECEVLRANLSETRMNVSFAAPAIAAMAPELLRNYNPQVRGWGDLQRVRQVAEREGKMYEPGSEPIVHAGFDLDNSETGGGAFNIWPVIVVEACGNKLRLDITQALRKIHLGAKLEAGVVKWSNETRTKTVELVKSQTVDSVKSFLDPEFLAGQLAPIEAKAGKELESPAKTIEHVSKELGYTQEQQDGILDHFLKGGQPTAGGVVNAVTSYAQTVESADEAYDLEAGALKALEVAYAAA